MTQHGVSITTEGHNYNFVVDTTAQVRDLLLNTTAPITEVIVMEEGYGKEARMLNAEEILAIVLNHPKPVLSLV
jgi:hypothetical protein